jgi:chitinase
MCGVATARRKQTPTAEVLVLVLNLDPFEMMRSLPARFAMMMCAAVMMLACSSSAADGGSAAVVAPWEKEQFTVFGYLPEYRLGGFNYTAAFQSGLTHLLFFSLEIDANGKPAALDRLPTKAAAKQAREAADKVGGKVMISFGGNSRSQNFGTMATNAKKRKVFLEALEKLFATYGFDGIDYNWEYPVNHQEWRAWGELMGETKALLGGKAIVSFTMYLDPNHYDVIQRYKLLEKAHYLHCMAYDQPRQHSTMAFFMSGIRYAREKGIDLSKFTMGLPFYSRDVRNGDPKTYGELSPQLDNEVDDQFGTHYFNSRTTIAKKVKAAREARIGGVMIWELGQDVQPLSSPKSLMTAIQGALPWQVPAAADDTRRDEL